MRYSVEYFDHLVIGRHLFRIEPEHRRLADLEHAGNYLPYAMMQQGKRALVFSYNEQSRSIEKIGQQQAFRLISIPYGVAMLQHEPTLKMYDHINKLSRYYDAGFSKLGQRYAERVMGISPRVKFPSGEYYLNVGSNSLGQTIGSSQVSLEGLMAWEWKGLKWMEGVYCCQQQQFLPLNAREQQVPVGSYFIQLPCLHEMDPVGMAALEGKRPYYYLNDYPIRAPFEAYAIKVNAPGMIKDQQLRNLKGALLLDGKVLPAKKKL